MTPEPGAQLILFDYWRSSASYRVRIALNLKGLSYDQRAVNLARGGGEQHHPEYRQVNPLGLVPALVHNGRVITQSLAICDYLDECFPQHSVLHGDAGLKADVRAMAMGIACDIHPLNNLRVLQYLKREMSQDETAVQNWYRHWIAEGFTAIELQLAKGANTGEFCFGDRPGLADCFLVPQVYNAERFDCDLSAFPVIRRIVSHCRQLEAFDTAQPERQPDAVTT
jgi:maleylacetoacetate isomerase